MARYDPSPVHGANRAITVAPQPAHTRSIAAMRLALYGLLGPKGAGKQHAEGGVLGLLTPSCSHHGGTGTGTVRLRRVRPDLTLDEGVVPPRTLLRGWAANGRLWVTSHPPERPGPDGWWPLRAPPAYPEDRQYWLLTELDPADLRPITNTLVHQLPHHLAVDGQGTVWVQSDGLRYCPPEEGAVAVHLDVAALLDEARSQADAPARSRRDW